MGTTPVYALRLAAALAALAAAACAGGGGESQEAAAPEVSVVTVKTQPVRLERQLPGRTRAFLVAEVRPQVDGIVEKRLFTEGGMVEAGQALYQLDDATYRAEYASALAALAKAEAARDTARLNARRFGELVGTGAVSEQDAENADALYKQAEAEVAAASALVASSKVTLDRARITAPISGRIGKSSVTPGALVTENQSEPLATVQQLDPIYVDVTQSASELLQLRRQMREGTLRGAEDMPVRILLEDGARYAHDGRLAFTDVTVDQSTGSYSLRVVVPNPDDLLLPGMYLRAVLDTGVRPEGMLVPQQAIRRDPRGNATALVVGADDTVEQRVVKTDRTIGDQWLVDEGLEPGERVIVEGLQKASPGARVQVVESVAATESVAPPAGSAM